MTSFITSRILLRKSRSRLMSNSRELTRENFTSESDLKIEQHLNPIMVDEVVQKLDLKEGSSIVDMTFGTGGHSSVLLEKVPDLKLVAVDRDPLTKTYMEKLLKKYPGQVTPIIGKFSDLPKHLKNLNFRSKIDGFLFDLGPSSLQLNNFSRGFSMNLDAPLDMRMEGPSQKISGMDVLAYAEEENLRKIFKMYGKIKNSKSLASTIVKTRGTYGPIKTVGDLKKLITLTYKGVKSEEIDQENQNFYKAYYAIRFFVNNEFNQLNYGIELAQAYLRAGGKLVGITYHTLEDRIFKRHFSGQAIDNIYPTYVESKKDQKGNFANYWEEIPSKLLTNEEKENSVYTSAKLRAAMKIVPKLQG